MFYLTVQLASEVKKQVKKKTQTNILKKNNNMWSYHLWERLLFVPPLLLSRL